ncbi:MAG: ABC transporter permease [Gemmatimonadaceae bacterium]
MASLFDRLRPSLRMLARHKRFSALAVLSLGLAIGLNTTMYSVLDALMNPVIEMRDPDRLFRVRWYGDMRQPRRLTDQMHFDALRSLRSFEAGAGIHYHNLRSQGPNAHLAERGSQSYPVTIRNVTPNYFAVLGTVPLRGRLLSEADVNVQPRPVVIGERLWKQLFPEQDALDAATIVLEGEPRVVIGVITREADFPGSLVDVWQILPPDALHFGTPMNLLRLRPDVTIRQARAELRVIADRFAAITGESPRSVAFFITPAIIEEVRVGQFHYALGLAVLAVLLVACVNLANLQLARGIARARELATRSALGASRGQLVRLLVSESAWLAAAGLAAGLLLTAWGMHFVATSLPPSFDEFTLRARANWRVFAFAALATFVALGFVGLLPAIRLSRVDINEVMKSGAGTGRSRRASRQYGTLVVVQVGFALALLVGATLLMRGAVSLYTMDIPPHYSRLLLGHARIFPTGRPINGKQPEDGRRLTDIGNHLLNRLRALPQVEHAAVSTSQTPVGLTIALADPGGVAKEIITGLQWSYRSVSSEYPRVLGLEVLHGRAFRPGEFAEPLVMVDDRTARFLWPGQDAIGQHIKLGRDSSRAPWLEVVGVMRHFNFYRPYQETNQEERNASRMGAVFVLNGTSTSTVGRGGFLQLVVQARRQQDMQKLPNQVREVLQEPGRGIGIGYAESWYQVTGLDRLRERQTFIASLFAAFALLALGIAALGVYAIVSHSVSQRTREFGVRIALGAEEGDIRRVVLSEGKLLALIGIAVGLMLARESVPLLERFLVYPDDIFNAPLFGLIALALFTVALLASYIPARRAMRINPTEALRNE